VAEKLFLFTVTPGLFASYALVSHFWPQKLANYGFKYVSSNFNAVGEDFKVKRRNIAMNSRKITKRVWKFTKGKKTRETSTLVREEIWSLFVQDTLVNTFLCSGNYLNELALGYLAYKGIISRREDVLDLEIDHEKNRMQINIAPECKGFVSFQVQNDAEKRLPVEPDTDACRKLKSRKGEDLVVDKEQVFELMVQLNEQSVLYKSTHGVHNSAIATPDKIIVFRDDIGRHNTMDMLRGYSLINDLYMGDKILVTTCRVTVQIIDKIIKMGIPIIASRGITTDLALTLAEEAGITLIGFLRGRRFLVYTGIERVIGE